MEAKCILYHGHISKTGYGLDYNPETKKTILAHRLAFKQAYGYLPKVVMHLCDVKACVKPEHLMPGTQSDNIKDCVKKGRHPSKPKLCVEDCIFVLSMTSMSNRALGKLLGVDQKTIYNIRKFPERYTGKGGSCGV